MFINLSNHPSERWDDMQVEAAEQYGAIMDMPFPNVLPNSTETELDELADDLTEQVMRYAPACVMCQGEFTLTYRIVERLKAKDVLVVAACSERRVREQMRADGTQEKISVFQFCQFRRY